jgi:AbiV family abortive infection protein
VRKEEQVRSLSPEQLGVIGRKSLDNAVALLDDADLLLEHARFPRASALAVLAAEEFGKMLMAFGALSLEPGDEQGWRRFWRRFKGHNPKYANAAMMLDAFVPEEDVSGYLEAMDEFVSGSIAQKMAGFYVDVENDGTVAAPQDVIGEDLTRRMLLTIGTVIRTHASIWERRDLSHYFKESVEQMRRIGRRDIAAMVEVLEGLDNLKG